MTIHADLVDRRWIQLRGIADEGCIRRFGVHGSRPVTGFASPSFKASFLVGLCYLMRILCKGPGDVFVA
jgi:hypothetical protein